MTFRTDIIIDVLRKDVRKDLREDLRTGVRIVLSRGKTAMPELIVLGYRAIRTHEPGGLPLTRPTVSAAPGLLTRLRNLATGGKLRFPSDGRLRRCHGKLPTRAAVGQRGRQGGPVPSDRGQYKE